jgi:hypothetical protein
MSLHKQSLRSVAFEMGLLEVTITANPRRLAGSRFKFPHVFQTSQVNIYRCTFCAEKSFRIKLFTCIPPVVCV